MISVVIGAFGDDRWRDLAWSRAYPSVQAQGEDAIVVYDPKGTVASVRNEGAAAAVGPWLCFLDADDELSPGYLDAMKAAMAAPWNPPALFAPRVSYIGGGGRASTPAFPQPVDYPDGNDLVIGTVVPKKLFTKVGGFEEWPIYEDWALFARMQKAGATVVRVPEAVYRAYRPIRGTRGRNHSVDRNGKLEVHQAIRRAVFPELYEVHA